MFQRGHIQELYTEYMALESHAPDSRGKAKNINTTTPGTLKCAQDAAYADNPGAAMARITNKMDVALMTPHVEDICRELYPPRYKASTHQGTHEQQQQPHRRQPIQKSYFGH
jgi:hypothetical protein